MFHVKGGLLMSGSSHSDQQMNSGRVNRAEDTTSIWVQANDAGIFHIDNPTEDTFFVVKAVDKRKYAIG